MRAFYERLARSFRLILFDKRGTGLSDHGAHFAALETRMEDLRAVLDEVGSTSTVVFGSHEGSGMAAMFAATYPERTRALVLFHPARRRASTRSSKCSRSWRNCARAGDHEYCDKLLRVGCPTVYDQGEKAESRSPTSCASAPARRLRTPSTALWSTPT